jgi:hypothetical protein
MLAEIFLLKLEAKARMAAPEPRSATPRDPRFVPLAPRA